LQFYPDFMVKVQQLSGSFISVDRRGGYGLGRPELDRARVDSWPAEGLALGGLTRWGLAR
jgi:hypothetical protein